MQEDRSQNDGEERAGGGEGRDARPQSGGGSSASFGDGHGEPRGRGELSDGGETTDRVAEQRVMIDTGQDAQPPSGSAPDESPYVLERRRHILIPMQAQYRYFVP